MGHPLQSIGVNVISRTRQYGFITAVAAWSILSGAALPTHDAVIFGAEGLLSQRLVTLCAAETLLVPVSALVAELLMEENGEIFWGFFLDDSWTQVAGNTKTSKSTQRNAAR